MSKIFLKHDKYWLNAVKCNKKSGKKIKGLKIKKKNTYYLTGIEIKYFIKNEKKVINLTMFLLIIELTLIYDWVYQHYK